MIKALILSRYFPPSGEVAGFRAEGWARYMPEFGIEPIVLTPSEWKHEDFEVKKHDLTRIVYFDYNGYDEGFKKGMPRIRRLTQRFMAYGTRLLRKNNFYQEASKLIESEEFDVIMVTAPPYYLIKIGAMLSKKYNIPWVADSRDAWTTNKASKAGGSLKNFVFRYLEKRAMRTACLITTVSPTNLEGIKSVNGSARVFCVENGFFEEDFEVYSDFSQSVGDRLKIAYLGALYPYMPIEGFVEGVKRFQEESKKGVDFNFIGIENQQAALSRVRRLLENEEHISLQTTHKIVRQQAIQRAIHCDILLLLADPEVNLLPTKIYDYMAMQRPIIVCKNDHSYIYELLSSYDNVYFASNSSEVVDALKDIVSRTQTFEFSIGDLKNNTHTRRNLSNQFAQLTLTRI